MTWMNWVSPGPILPSTSEHRQILLALSGVSRHSLARSQESSRPRGTPTFFLSFRLSPGWPST